MRRRWSGDPRVVVDVVVAVVVAVLSVLDVAAATDGSRGQRPADALAYALVITGVAQPVLEAAGSGRRARLRHRRARRDVPA